MACAEDEALPLSSYTATTWTPREGAPTYITGLAQTTDGTLWIASPSGLFQFDGIRFRRYGDAPNEVLASQFVRTLTAPATGGLWIGFQLGGVAFLEDGTLTTYSVKQGLPEGTVRKILVDRNGTVWIATTAGLGKLVNGRWQPIEELPADAAALLETRAGVIWTRVGKGLFFKRPGEEVFTRLADSDSYSNVDDAGLAEAPDGALWAIDAQRGLRTVTGDAVSYETDTTNRGDYAHLLFEPDGVLWYFLGYEVHRLANPQALRVPANLARLRNEKLGEAAGLATPESIFSALRDREGNVWLGASDGLIRLARASFHVAKIATLQGFTLSSSPDDSIVWL